MQQTVLTNDTQHRPGNRARTFGLHVTLLGLALIAGPVFGHPHESQRKAVTLWWVIFNNPDGCIANPSGVERCGEVDIFGQAFLDSVAAGEPDPAQIAPNLASELAVIYATGGLTDRRGRIRLTASIYRSEQPLSLAGGQVIDPLGLGQGFSDLDAEVHLVVRTHGRLVDDGSVAQTTGFLEPFCSDPLLLFEGGENICADLQAAFFAPGETGQDAVIELSSGQILADSAAFLFRQGDALQAVVHTRVHDEADNEDD